MSEEIESEEALVEEEDEGEEDEDENEGQGDRAPDDYKKNEKEAFNQYCLHPTKENSAIPGLTSILWSMLKQLKVGMDLSKVVLPVEFCEPRSLPEKLTDIMNHIDFATKPKKNSLERMIGIVRWMIAGWYIQPPGARKPYNPILGEVFRGHWTDNEDDSIYTFFAEQVSHHPPISAFYGENRVHNIEMSGFYHSKSQFLGNSVGAISIGWANVHFKDCGEVYRVDFPDYYIRGLLVGSLRLEIAGDVTITCEQSDYSAKIKFKSKPYIGGDYHVVKGAIRNDKIKKDVAFVEGKWNDKLFLTMNDGSKSSRKLFFDSKDCKRLPFQFIPRKSLKEYESHRVWGALTREVHKGSLEGSRREKIKVEEAQRVKRKERAKKKEVWKNRFFSENEDTSWSFNGRDHEMYKVLLKKWLQ